MALLRSILCSIGLHSYRRTRFTVFSIGAGSSIQFRVRKTCRRCGKTSTER